MIYDSTWFIGGLTMNSHITMYHRLLEIGSKETWKINKLICFFKTFLYLYDEFNAYQENYLI